MTCAQLIFDYIRHHNKGVRDGNFSDYFELFSPQTEIIFDGSDFGPFKGPDAVAKAFSNHPPDQEIEVYDLNLDANGGTVVYGWRKQSKVFGSFRVDIHNDMITRVVVYPENSSVNG